ncbi:MAG TPA: BamA/TamA family outer membrane protein [Cyclobacteriaceae bacterium]|nr:BamA/TamA family outer membrane protein [Cyclobacteriaceae bacterium]
MRTSFLVLLFIVGSTCLYAQQDSCVEKDLPQILFKKKGDEVTPKIVIKKPTIILFPVLASSPATGFQFGAVGQGAWFMGTPETTRISQTSANFTYTTKNQFLVTIKSNVMTKDDDWILTGDWRYYLYSQSTYGLGTNSPHGIVPSSGFSVQGYDVDSNHGAEPMEFTWLRLHETIFKEIKKDFYIGLGYHLDSYSNIVDKNLDVATNQFTNHYSYSISNGFNPNQYTLSGISINFVYDSRDNQINPYKGMYINIQNRYSPEFLGSAQFSNITYTELRGYKNLSKKHPRHLLAGWLYSNYVNAGKAPYLTLPASAYDRRNTSARGYVQGRFRGENLYYGEVEYRFPISKCTNVLGGVLFVNAITTSDHATNVHTFDYVKPAYGFGLRIMADKLSRTNVNIDWGFGDHSSGIYFGATEVF